MMIIKRLMSNIECRIKRHGFSLTEVLLAVGTLAVGMLFIAGVFPVSIYFTTIASERTIAATVADEAFAKIKLYGISDANLSYISQNLYENVALTRPFGGEFAYPSTPTSVIAAKKYWWSAICRRIDISDVQVTVFISRKAGTATTYLTTLNTAIYPPIRPVAMAVEVTGTAGDYELTITGITGNKTWINDGYTIVDNATGQIYRVLERYKAPNDSVIRLDKPWRPDLPPQTFTAIVWVVPPPPPPPVSTGGRYPCIAVYQKVMRF
jgi:type II secretory pathway pseudopilin PulG